MKKLAIALLALCVLSAHAAQRSRSEIRKFVSVEACPATGVHKLPCPGWEVDHITPLCAGGEDRYWNMQWLSKEDHKFKTRVDVRECRRRPPPNG